MKQRNGWGIVLWVCLMAMAGTAWAQHATAVRKQAEASLLVTGMITIRTDGSVAAVDLDAPDKLPAGIADFVSATAATWQFEPYLIDGKARQVKTKLSARLVGTATGDGKMDVAIRGVDFGDYHALPTEQRLVSRDLKPPTYPAFALENGVQGIVYVLVKVDREGKVEDAVAEQVNLRLVASEPQMRQFRERLARSALQAAQAWTFDIPTAGEEAGQPHFRIRVPVDFTIGTVSAERRYGRWEAYVPGPRERPSWAGDDNPGFSLDTLAEGRIAPVGGKQGPRLLTPLDGA
jgi:hypothetical protein